MKLIRPLIGSPIITQPFGPTDVVGEPAFHIWPHFHQGTDYACPIGTLVMAMGAGTVRIGHDDEWGYGTHCTVDHGNGFRTLYGHLNQIIAHDGDHVGQGQTIAHSGNTGNSTGPHLHAGVITAYDYPLPLQAFIFD